MSGIICQTDTEILQLLWEIFSIAFAPTHLPHCIAHEMTDNSAGWSLDIFVLLPSLCLDCVQVCHLQVFLKFSNSVAKF